MAGRRGFQAFPRSPGSYDLQRHNSLPLHTPLILFSVQFNRHHQMHTFSAQRTRAHVALRTVIHSEYTILHSLFATVSIIIRLAVVTIPSSSQLPSPSLCIALTIPLREVPCPDRPSPRPFNLTDPGSARLRTRCARMSEGTASRMILLRHVGRARYN